MLYVLIILATIALSVIAYQDWMSRSVYWFWFPILAVVGFFMSLIAVGAAEVLLQYLFVNLVFLAVQLLVLKGYFFIRRPKDSGLVDKKIGLGDLLFLAAACCFFSPLNFMMFYLGSLVFAIAAFSIYSGVKQMGGGTKNAGIERGPPGTMPLAGLQAVFFITCLFISMISKYSLLDDRWLIKKLGG
jgi:hypothetical protein